MTKILLLGVFHFAASEDEFAFDKNVQEYLQKLNESFVKFNPDKIGIEFTARSQKGVDASYNLFNLNDLSDIDKMKNQTLGTIDMYGAMSTIS